MYVFFWCSILKCAWLLCNAKFHRWKNGAHFCFLSSPSCSFFHFSIFPFIHSFIDASGVPFFLQSTHPLFHPSCHSFVHTSSPGSLRQEVLQLQLSSKASLKGNSSDPWPQLSVQLEVCPEALEPHSSAWCNPSSHCHAQITVCFNYSQLRWKSLNPPVPHITCSHCVLCWLTGWISHYFLFSVLMHVMLQHHKLTPNLHADSNGCLGGEHHRTIKEVYSHLTISSTKPAHLQMAASILYSLPSSTPIMPFIWLIISPTTQPQFLTSADTGKVLLQAIVAS